MTVGSDLSGAVVLVVHAHPDDEVFATGAATIAAKEAGARVHHRIFTGGEGRARGTSLPDLEAARRRKEARLAVSARLLGIDAWAYLTEPGRWTDTPHAPERTIATTSLDELAAPVAQAIESLRPDVLLTVGPDGLTDHPDHIACHDTVRHALTQSAHTPRWTPWCRPRSPGRSDRLRDCHDDSRSDDRHRQGHRLSPQPSNRHHHRASGNRVAPPPRPR